MKMSVQRLYGQSMEHKSTSMALLVKKLRPPLLSSKPIDSEALETSLNHLYYDAIKKREASRSPKRAARKDEKLSLPELKAKRAASTEHVVTHLVKEQIEREQKRQEKLAAKYITTTAPKSVKLTRAEIDEAIKRLAGDA
jgi:hypothetical protein